MGNDGTGQRCGAPGPYRPRFVVAVLTTLVCTAALAGLALVLSSAPVAAQDRTGPLVALHSGLCLTVRGGSTAAGTPVVQEPCTNQPSQTWTPIDVGGGWFRLQVAHSGQCLNVEGASTADRARVIQWPCVSASNSEFRFEPTATTPGRIIARHSNKCVNIPDALTTPGLEIIQWSCTSGAANELFTLGAPGADPARVGRWSPVIGLPLVPVAVSNLPDGRVLMWSAFSKINFGGDFGLTQTAIFNPATSAVTERQVANTGHDMFCPGTAHLPDGRILINGGSSARETTIYDPATDTWIDAADMNIPRGYQGTTPTGDGSVFTLGGSWSGGIGGKHGELWTPAGGWRRLSGVPVDPFLGTDPEGVYRDDNHLWLFGWKNNSVFHAGPSRQMNWIDTRGDGSVAPAGVRAADGYAMNGNAVMYAPGRILAVGGAPAYVDGAATANATVIDINGPTVTARTVAPMANRRVFHNSVVLPNGEVVVTGGQATARAFSDVGAVFVTEIWDPATETFRNVAPITVPRNYHGVSLLLTDGRVLVGGGGLCNNCGANHLDLQIYSPPYLFNPDGTEAVRPRIISAPDTVDLDQVFSVTTSAAIRDMVLVRMSTATHSVNNDQRRIPLTFTPAGANLTWRVTAPTDPGVAIPGLYMLFALDANGVPSVAKIVRVTTDRAVVDTRPGSITGTVTDGDGDGAPVAGVNVDLFTTSPNNTRGTYIRSTTTDSEGTYRFDQVTADCHTVTFVAPAGRAFTNDRPWFSLTPCPEPGRTVTGVDARLRGGAGSATVSGAVADLGANPAPSVGVDLFEALADGSRGAYVRSTSTAADGTYRFADLPARCYVLTFVAPDGRTFTNGNRWLNQGTCPAPSSTVAGLDARLAGGTTAAIVGTVANGDGTARPGVAVDLFTSLADGSRGAYLTSTTTGTDGRYRFDTGARCHTVTVIAPDGTTFSNGTRWLNLTACPSAGGTTTAPDARLN